MAVSIFRLFCGAAFLSLVVFRSPGSSVIESDICVYGGTSGGVAAAVATARLGKSAVLVVFNNHVGGMSSGGLGVTDKGNASSIGGLPAEVYSSVGQYYDLRKPAHPFL